MLLGQVLCCLCFLQVMFCFFKQKTAYELRISDWSSDVCSSDLARLGMEPSAWRNGGRGVTIRYGITATNLGPLLVAATMKGIFRLSFDEDAEALRARFPHAAIEPGGEDFQDLMRRTAASVEKPDGPVDLPIDVRGTAFQEAVWQAPTRIPPGETRSYAQLAQIGRANV